MFQSSSGYTVCWPEGEQTYPSARKTIIALVNGERAPQSGAYDPHLTWDRYFRRGRYSRGTYPLIDVLSLFLPNQKLAVVNPSISASSEVLVVHLPKGIDLAKRGIEVKKLFYAGFARGVLKKGYDTDDVLQELFKALLVRNNGKCPWDPSKSSFGHYVHMVCRGVVSNYHRKHSRVSRSEFYGVRSVDGTIVDVSQSDLARCKANQLEVDHRNQRLNLLSNLVEISEAQGRDANFTTSCLTLLSEGFKQKEIAQELGCSAYKVSETVRWARSLLSFVS